MEQKQLEQIKEKLLADGFDRAAVFTGEMLDLAPAKEVREMCRVNYCGRYGKSWSCPPACGEIEECVARLQSYPQGGVLVQKVYPLEDSYDFEGAQEGQRDFNALFDRITQEMRAQYSGVLPLSAGTCNKCEKCTYPDQPCRYPESLTYSVESQGILVSALCKKCGVPYISGQNTVTYIGLFLFK